MRTQSQNLIPILVAALAVSAPTQDLTEAQLIEKARGIHKRVITLDTHKDISASLASEFSGADIEDPAERELQRQRHAQSADPTVDGRNQVDFPKMRAGDYDCAFFIVFVGQASPLNPAVYSRMHNSAMLKFDAIDRMGERFPDDIEIAYTPDDVRRIAAEGKLIACIGIENGGIMGEDLSKIALYQKRGARYMSITHNGNNQLGDSQSAGRNPASGGLTELGKKAVAEMNRVGIMVDVSHADKKTMMDAVAASQAPVIASHSGVDAIRVHGRNLDDEQLLALKENGGVIQCVAFASYVSDTTPNREATAALRAELGMPATGRGRGRGAGRGTGRGGRGAGRGTGRGGRAAGGGRRGGRGQAAEASIDPAIVAKYNERKKEIDAKFPGANVSSFADHIDHAVKLIGLEHVAISSDFDGGGGLEGWRNASETFNVTLELVRRGYTEEQIGMLWSGNTLRVWAEVEAIAKKLQSGK